LPQFFQQKPIICYNVYKQACAQSPLQKAGVAMDPLHDELKQLCREIYGQVVEIRHILHRQPELGYQEFQTAALVENYLNKWAISYERLPGGTAIIARIDGRPGERCVAVRADMDALPLQEETRLDYQSGVPGVMHACGHDLHTANLLGVAYMLSRLKNRIDGCVKCFFQPAEEIGGGAQEMIDYGCLENPKVNAVLAGHTSEGVAVGQVKVKAEEIMLASTGFLITLSGRGGHGAAPHLTEDIVLAAARLIAALQDIPGRKHNFLDPAVITVCSIHGGAAGNIIPKEVALAGTIRTPNSRLLPKIRESMQKELSALEMTTGVKGAVVFRQGSDAVYNDPGLTELFVGAAKSIIGEQNVLKAKFPANGSENFALFSSRVPSVFFHFGVSEKGAAVQFPAHSPRFLASDQAFATSLPVTVAAALAFLSARE
jgi:amidohydrolase